MYITNNEGRLRYKFVSKNFTQTLIYVPVAQLIIIWLLYLSVGTKSILYFYLMLLYILAFLAFAFYSTYRQLNRQSRTISVVDFLNDEVVIKTDKIIWLKAKEYKINKSNIHFKNRKFDWYGKNTEKAGLSIFVNDFELFLVKDYFDDYENIIKLLS